jgi:hypothetical protein
MAADVVARDEIGVNRGNWISDNWIHHTGVQYRAASGIWTPRPAHLDHTIRSTMCRSPGFCPGPVRTCAASASPAIVCSGPKLAAQRGGIYVH